MSDPSPYMALFELMSGLVEATAGYRARALEAGFSPEMADAMAMQFHTAAYLRITGATVGD